MKFALRKSIRHAVFAGAVAACFAGMAFAQETGLPPISADGEPQLVTKPAVEVKGFRFEGNTAFEERHLLDVPVDAERVGEEIVIRARVKDFVGKSATTEDLEAIRQALTRFYIAAGYINSGAVLPDQNVEDGLVTYRIVEGKLSDVNIQYIQRDNTLKDKGRLNKTYISSRVERAAKPPLNIVKLKNQLEVLRQNPNLSRINAELRPGAEPGDAYLDVQVAETNPWQFGLQVSNHRSPSVGGEQVELLASNRNLTGNSDVLGVRYGVNTGGFDHWEWAGADDFSVDYSLPISPSDTTLVISYTKTDSLVVEEPFDELDITSESNTLFAGVRQPFYRSANTEFAMFLGLSYRDNKTELLGDPFSFSPGSEDGKSVVVPVRFGQEFSTRSQIDAFALRSTFSIGTGLFDATQHGDKDIPDGNYLAWLGQLQYVRRLNPKAVNPLHDWQLVLRGSAQLSSDPLLSIEQFAIGGIDTVRGYRENQIVRDLGVAGTVELRIPLVATTSGNRVLDLVPFVDLGYGQNKVNPKNGEFLPSVGVGLLYTPNRHVTAQLYYGYAINRDINQETDDLQDAGIHFNVLVLAF